MWDKILPDDLLIKVFHFNSPRPPTSDNFFGLVRRFEECCHVFHLATFTFIYCSDCFQEDCVAMYSVLLGDWMPGVPPGQLRQLGGKQLVSQLNQGSTTSILFFINPIVLVSRIQLERNAWIHWSVQRITICFKLIVQRCILIQINVNYIAKYIYIWVRFPRTGILAKMWPFFEKK